MIVPRTWSMPTLAAAMAAGVGTLIAVVVLAAHDGSSGPAAPPRRVTDRAPMAALPAVHVPRLLVSPSGSSSGGTNNGTGLPTSGRTASGSTTQSTGAGTGAQPNTSATATQADPTHHTTTHPTGQQDEEVVAPPSGADTQP